MICILGMHRSGTSCIAGTLQAAGVHFGQVSTANRHNLKGNRENPAILALHDDLLEDNGGCWSNPPLTVRWARDHRLRRDAIVAGLAVGAAHWGFKDPRTLFTLDGWLETAPHPSVVGVVRHPHAVARSLERRSGMSAADALDLWIRYNRRLLEFREIYKFPMVRFDAPAADLIVALRTLCQRLNLDPIQAASFFDNDLRHHIGTEENWDGISGDALALYEALSASSL